MAKDTRTELLKTYARLAKAEKAFPTRAQLKAAGISRDTFRNHFGDLEAFKAAAKLEYPKSFEGIVDETRFNEDVFSALAEKSEKFKRFFITTAVAGCPVDKKFLQSIQSYCKSMHAMLLILPADNQLQDLDPALVEHDIVFDELELNSNIRISNIKIGPKQIDPITGLARFAQECSFIFASPKQRMKPIAVSNKKLPHVLMTTGAVTDPRYHGKKYINKRTDYIAHRDHVKGGIIVEVLNDDEYYFRQVQADHKGRFIDLGKQYAPDGEVTKVNALAVAYGDYHAGETDPHGDAGGRELCKLLKPKFLILHDMFDGRSISHHDKDKSITLARKSAEKKDSLATELFDLARATEKLADLAETLVWVKSNHDEFLHRWLERGGYIGDPKNALLGHKLSAAMIEGKDPLRHALEDLMSLKHADKITWLERDEDFTLAGVQCGAHGDKGPNGSRGTVAAMEASYGSSITGHGHSPEILRETWRLGTKCKLKQDYAEGASSWLLSDIVLYPNGARQMITYIEGRWYLRDSKE